MKSKIAVTLALCILLAGSLGLARLSYEEVISKRNLRSKNQQTMELLVREEEKEPPKEEKKPDPTPEPEATPTPVPVDPELPVLTLVSDTVEITAGSSFDLIAQVADITDNKDDRSTLFHYIRVNGSYDIYKPGEYQLEYIVTDTDGNPSLPKVLKLVVK